MPPALGQASRSGQCCSISGSHTKQSGPWTVPWRATSDQMFCCGDKYGTSLDLLLVQVLMVLWSPSQHSLLSVASVVTLREYQNRVPGLG